jgi:hypothetical protein
MGDMSTPVPFSLPVEFRCYVCGDYKEVICAPDPEFGNCLCPNCCSQTVDGHDYQYDRYEQTHVCDRCGQFAPYDWLADYHSDDFASVGFGLRDVCLPESLGTPISELSGQPGHKGYERFCEIARSWGYD